MTDAQVSGDERGRLLAEIGGEPPRPAPAAAATSAPPAPSAPARPPRAPSRLWRHRGLVAAVVMLAAGSAWLAVWMVSARPAAAGLALLGIAGGAWVALRPKKY